MVRSDIYGLYFNFFLQNIELGLTVFLCISSLIMVSKLLRSRSALPFASFVGTINGKFV